MNIELPTAVTDLNPIWVKTANFGMLAHYLDIPPGRIHGDVPGVLFQVPQPRTSVLDRPYVSDIHIGFAGVLSGVPLALIAFRVGRQFIAAAFNPLEPATRATMRHLREVGELPIAIEFDYGALTPGPKQDFALFSLGCDVFGAVLDETEGLPPVCYEAWLPNIGERVVRELPNLGYRLEDVYAVELNCFAVLPAGPWPVVDERGSAATARH